MLKGFPISQTCDVGGFWDFVIHDSKISQIRPEVVAF